MTCSSRTLAMNSVRPVTSGNKAFHHNLTMTQVASPKLPDILMTKCRLHFIRVTNQPQNIISVIPKMKISTIFIGILCFASAKNQQLLSLHKHFQDKKPCEKEGVISCDFLPLFP